MKRMELILIITAVLGEIFALSFIPGGILLFVLSMWALALLYFFGSVLLFNDINWKIKFKKDSYKDTASNHLLGAGISGVVFSVCCIGIMFKMLHWPMGSFQLFIASCASLILAIACLAKLKQKPGAYYRSITKRAVAFCVICWMLVFIPQLFFIKIRYHNYPTYIETMKQVYADPQNNDLRKKEREQWEEINKYR